MDKTNTEPGCENCGKPLFGRLDKRFCNDGCRNEFNRKKRADARIAEYENLPQILKIIKRNHEILKSYNLEHSDPGTMISINRAELLQKGYHFKFFTSLYRDRSGELWKYCFDYGIKEATYAPGANQCEITYRLAQIEVDDPDTFIVLNYST